MTVATATRIKYRHKLAGFSGHVTFPNGASSAETTVCDANRQIVLHKAETGDFLANTPTGTGGGWFIGGFHHPHGGFYAVVKKATRTLSDGTVVNCTKGRSDTIFP